MQRIHDRAASIHSIKLALKSLHENGIRRIWPRCIDSFLLCLFYGRVMNFGSSSPKSPFSPAWGLDLRQRYAVFDTQVFHGIVRVGCFRTRSLNQVYRFEGTMGVPTPTFLRKSMVSKYLFCPQVSVCPGALIPSSGVLYLRGFCDTLRLHFSVRSIAANVSKAALPQQPVLCLRN